MVINAIRVALKIKVIAIFLALLGACGSEPNTSSNPDGGSTASPDNTASSRVSSVMGGDSSAFSSSIASSTPAVPVMTYQLDVRVEGEGSVNVSRTSQCEDRCTFSFASMTDLMIGAVAADDFIFDRWQGDCQGDGACQVSLDQNMTITAIFKPKIVEPQKISVLLNVDGQGAILLDSASCSNVCDYDIDYSSGVKTLKAQAAAGYAFERWLGACAAQQNPCQINSVADVSVTAVFSEEMDTPVLESFSLINAETNQPIAEFDPLVAGAVINIDRLPTQQLNLRANTRNTVGSIYFVLDQRPVRTENVMPYALAGDDGAGNYSAWDLTLGNHEVLATPYAQTQAQGAAGMPLKVNFKLVAIRMSADKNRLNFDARIPKNGGASEAITHQLIISNNGNDRGVFSVDDLPSWVSVDMTEGTVLAGQQQNLQVTAEGCSEAVERSVELTIKNDEAIFARIALEQHCLPFTETTYDLSLERVYFMQSTTQQDSNQSADARIPLVAERDALVRTFVKASLLKGSTMVPPPLPRITLFYQQPNGQSGELALTGPSTVPSVIDESDLQNTFNGTLKAANLQVGTQVYIVVDPDNEIPETNERNNRYPEVGYWVLDTKKVPKFDITFVPVVVNGERPMVTQQRARELLGESLALHPIEQYTINVRAPYTYNGNSWTDMLGEVSSLRRSDGSNHFYHGLIVRGPDNSNTLGIAYLSDKAAVSDLDPITIAHELGHNFGRPHAPCGGVAGGDSKFPYSNARTGVWGFDDRTNRLVSPENADYMSYCSPSWVSDYNYGKVLGALFNSQIGFKSSGVLSTEVWQIEGVLRDEVMRIKHWQNTHQSGKLTAPEPHMPGPYWAKLLSADNQVLGRTQFGMKTLDHATEEHFYLAIANDYAGEPVAAIALGVGDELLHRHVVEIPAQAHFKAALPFSKTVVAKRLDAQRVRLQWPAKGKTLVIRNSLGQVLARDKTGSVIVFDRGDRLIGELLNTRNTTAFDIQIDSAAEE